MYNQYIQLCVHWYRANVHTAEQMYTVLSDLSCSQVMGMVTLTKLVMGHHHTSVE